VTNDEALRQHLARLLAWEEAHVSYDTAVKDLEPHLRGAKPAGLPYSPWQLVEHLRLCQRDILDFCRDPDYEERSWPDDYWPSSAQPPTGGAWESSVRGFTEDREALRALALDREIPLEAKIPHGSGQTYLRELLLVADHSAYHVGELVVVRRLLGSWFPK
jgi:hypothetical protein